MTLVSSFTRCIHIENKYMPYFQSVSNYVAEIKFLITIFLQFSLKIDNSFTLVSRDQEFSDHGKSRGKEVAKGLSG